MPVHQGEDLGRLRLDRADLPPDLDETLIGVCLQVGIDQALATSQIHLMSRVPRIFGERQKSLRCINRPVLPSPRGGDDPSVVRQTDMALVTSHYNNGGVNEGGDTGKSNAKHCVRMDRTGLCSSLNNFQLRRIPEAARKTDRPYTAYVGCLTSFGVR
jgi:hypothetical protein